MRSTFFRTFSVVRMASFFVAILASAALAAPPSGARPQHDAAAGIAAGRTPALDTAIRSISMHPVVTDARGIHWRIFGMGRHHRYFYDRDGRLVRMRAVGRPFAAGDKYIFYDEDGNMHVVYRKPVRESREAWLERRNHAIRREFIELE